MRVYGIDFTSRPKRRKQITCMECVLEGDTLQAGDLVEWTEFKAFEDGLERPGPWIAGIDFPFGQARRFIETIGWPKSWPEYVAYVSGLDRKDYRAELDAYRQSRPPGDKEHRRATDRDAKSISPQKLYGTPVGLMFFEGAPRLQKSGVTIPGLQQGDPDRIVVEAYPGVLARNIIGSKSYKQDTRSKQTPDQGEARRNLLEHITKGGAKPLYGLNVKAPMELTDDPGGDHLDALLCAIQAAWSWTRRKEGFGMSEDIDPLEGWIADPAVTNSSTARKERNKTAGQNERMDRDGKLSRSVTLPP